MSCLVAGLSASVWSTGSLLASPTATITGRITNSLGGVLQGAQVEATNLETNAAFRTVSNTVGLYRIPNLQPGPYRIIVRMFGFRTIVKPGVRLHVQDVIALNFAMQVGSVISSVTESEGIPLIQAETAMQSVTVNRLAIRELPSLTRNPYDFVSISPGANPSSAGRGIGFAVNGKRPESASFLLDGSDNNEPYDSGPGQIVPLDAVEEYRLLTHNYGAEYGRNAGLVANVVTKTGTNSLQGVAYYFNRNSALAANTFENNSRGISRPVFNRHQMGLALGGPIYRDKLFFFGAVEPILVRSSAALSYYVPTPALLQVSSAGTNAIFRDYRLPARLSSTDVSIRTVCPFGRGCGSKISTGFVTIPAFALTSRTGPVDAGAGTPQTTYLWTNRVDYLVNERTTLNVRYAFQDADQFATVSQPYSEHLDQPSRVRNQSVTLNLTHFWHGNLFTESRVVFNRLVFEAPSVPALGFPSFAITGDAISGSTRALSLPNGASAFGGPQNNHYFYQAVNWIRGRHNLRFGGQFVHLRDNRIPKEALLTRGNLGEFRDVQNFVNGELASYQISLDPKNHLPGEPLNPPLGPAAVRRHFHFNDLAFFLQDTWKVSSRLTGSYGLRYEYFGQAHRPAAEKTLDSNFYYGEGRNFLEQFQNGQLARTTEAPGVYRNHFFLPQKKNIAPRLGVAYDVTGKGTTVVRAGAGIFYERLPGIAVENLNPPAYSVSRFTDVVITPSLLRDPYSLFAGNTLEVPPSAITHFDQNLRSALTTDWNLTLEHEIARRFVVSTAYLGSQGRRLYRLVNLNRIGSGVLVGRPGERLYSNASGFTTVNNLGSSSYHAFQLRVESPGIRPLGLQFGTGYTWGHSLDNVSSLLAGDVSGGLSGFPLDAFHPQLDKGSSDHDQRHRLVSHFVWQVPVGSGASGLKKAFSSGWQISGILSFQTGQPFSLSDNRVPDRELADVTRPRVTGTMPRNLSDGQLIADARTPNTYLFLPLNAIRTSDGSCIEDAVPLACQHSVNGPFSGALGRNTFRRPGTHFQNVAFIKNFDLPRIGGREGIKLQWRMEFYNLLNHSNLYLKVESGNVAAPSFNTKEGLIVPGVVASYGTPDRSPQEARQIVMALKLIF
ncbi:MAG: TonB-dependent receptor [Acidobacteriota bacterium]